MLFRPRVAPVGAVCRLAFVGFGLLLLWPQSVEAFPYFARKYDVSCQACHSVVPKLNVTGVAFRERGYRLDRPTFKTIPFAGGFALRFESRTSEGISDAYLKVVKVGTGGPIGSRASFLVKWHAVHRDLDRFGRLVDRSGMFEDLLLNVDVSESTRLTVGQFRVFNQFDGSRQLYASVPLALMMGVEGEDAGDARMRELRGFAPGMRTPAVMITRGPTQGGERSIDGWYMHAALPFSGELGVASTERSRSRAVLEPRPEGLFLETYHRQGLRTMGGAAFVDTDRQLYTGMLSVDPGLWSSSFVYSQAIQRGEGTRRLSWWGEYRPSHRSNVGLRIDDPGSWIEGTLYGDYQWFTERAMVWLVLQQKLREGGNVSLAQVKLVF